jgi:hypothetical protein
MHGIGEYWGGSQAPSGQHENQPPMAERYGWWFADCPRHGRTPHLAIFNGRCERCAADQAAEPFRRTRQ